jgi:DNA mismatch repair ATPase MutS
MAARRAPVASGLIDGTAAHRCRAAAAARFKASPVVSPMVRSSDSGGGPMQVDPTTLADLEIFGSAGSRLGLFDFIDRTTTSRGRSALRQRIARPASDAATIRRTQEAVAFLRRHPGIVRLDDGMLQAVTGHLQSNIATEATSRWGERLEYVWMKLRYRDLVQEIAEGVRATVDLFDRVARLCSALDEQDPPPVIADLTMQLRATAELVLLAHASADTLLGADRAFRSFRKVEIEESLRLLGELDALNGMAAATDSLGWVLPELIESDGFVMDAEGVYHPFVEHPVPNPIRLSGGEPMVFLTGPNMAGKTTYLRSVALVVLLAQVGMGVPARRVRLSPVDALFTSLNPSDNLRAGLSYFYAEVMRVKAAATILAQGRRALVIFDEVFKGTNVRDALDASAEVILGFARARGSGFIFSSHLVELVDVLRSRPSIRFACFDGEIHDGVPFYDYELKDGVSEKHFGLLLLRQAEVPELMAKISARHEYRYA